MYQWILNHTYYEKQMNYVSMFVLSFKDPFKKKKPLGLKYLKLKMQIMINQTDLPPAGSQASPVQGKDDRLPSAGEHLRGIGKRREHRSVS